MYIVALREYTESTILSLYKANEEKNRDIVIKKSKFHTNHCINSYNAQEYDYISSKFTLRLYLINSLSQFH